MDRQSSIDLILDHYEHPRNRGTLHDPTLDGERVNPGCGDVIRITARLDGGDRIEAIRFDGQGCTISQAAASIFTEMALGRSLADVLAIDRDTLMDMLGRDLVIQRADCATLALEALREAAQNHQGSSVG
jgi:nitrogen fixation NifU-like protein